MVSASRCSSPDVGKIWWLTGGQVAGQRWLWFLFWLELKRFLEARPASALCTGLIHLSASIADFFHVVRDSETSHRILHVSPTGLAWFPLLLLLVVGAPWRPLQANMLSQTNSKCHQWHLCLWVWSLRQNCQLKAVTYQSRNPFWTYRFLSQRLNGDCSTPKVYHSTVDGICLGTLSPFLKGPDPGNPVWEFSLLESNNDFPYKLMWDA